MVAQRQIADGTVEIALGIARQVHRRAALSWQRRDGFAILGDHPEAGAQANRHRLQHAREIEREDADAHAQARQGLAVFLAELGELLLDGPAGQHAQTLAELEDHAAGAGRQFGGGARVHQFAEAEADSRLDPSRGALAHFFSLRAVEQVGGDGLDLGRQHVAGRQQPCDGATAPADAEQAVEDDLAVGTVHESLQAIGQILAQRAQGRAQHRLLIGLSFGCIRHKTKALDASEMLAFNDDFAGCGDCRVHFTLIAQSSYKQSRASIDKPLRQPLMQNVGKPVLDGAGAFLPVDGALNPVGTMRNIGPGANVRDACHQRVDVAVEVLQALHMALYPVFGQPLAALRQMPEKLRQQGRVLFRHRLAEVRNLADLPQQPDALGRVQARQKGRLCCQGLQSELVVLLAHALERGMRWVGVQRGDQRRHRAEVEIAVAPLQVAQRIEAMVLDRLDDIGIEAADAGRRAERAVVHVASGASGDLRQFAGAQRAGAAAVVFAQGSEPHMVHIHVEAHADRVGRHEVIHLARLEHVDLRVARARAHRSHDDRRAAALSADQFGDLVDFVRGEADDRGAARQARRLLRADIGEVGEARACDDVDVRQQPVQHRADRVRPQQHGLVQPARMQQPVGEEMAALRIGRHLHFVDRKEGDRPVDRHRLDGAYEIARARGRDLLLAGDQRDLGGALQLDDAVVVLARQQAQREADHARIVPEHALDREVGLAGVGGTEDGGQAAGGAGKRHGRHLRLQPRRKQGDRPAPELSPSRRVPACCSRSSDRGRSPAPARPCPGWVRCGRRGSSSSWPYRPSDRPARCGARC